MEEHELKQLGGKTGNYKVNIHTNKIIALYIPILYNVISSNLLGETMNHELKPREQVNARGITIEDSYWEFARQLGHGNASKGIRLALYQAFLAGRNDASKSDLFTTTTRPQMEG